MSIDRASRFVVAWASGPREETLAQTVVATTRQRTAGQVGIPYVSDGWTPYEDSIRRTYRDREASGIRPGWDILRPMNAQELKSTTVLSLPLNEASAKIRTGGPKDDEEDYVLPIWAGVVPLKTQVFPPAPDERNLPGVAPPAHVSRIKIG